MSILLVLNDWSLTWWNKLFFVHLYTCYDVTLCSILFCILYFCCNNYSGTGPLPPSSSSVAVPPTSQSQPMLGAFQRNGGLRTPSEPGQTQGSPWSTSSPNSQGRNTPYGSANFSPHPSSSSSHTSSPQMSSPQINSPQINSSSASPVANFSRDMDLHRHQNVDLRNSPFSNVSPPSVLTTTGVPPPVGPVGAPSYPSFQTSMTNPSTTSFPVGGTGRNFSPSQGEVGMMPQNGQNNQPWQGGGGGDVRKRKLETELAQFEMQVGPSKQMRTELEKVRQYYSWHKMTSTIVTQSADYRANWNAVNLHASCVRSIHMYYVINAGPVTSIWFCYHWS